MATATKKVSEMTDEEFRAAKAGLRAQPAAPEPAERRPSTHLLWGDVAATIKAMTPLDMEAFSQVHGISIVQQDTHKMKRFSQMTPEEKEAFMELHGIPDQRRAAHRKEA